MNVPSGLGDRGVEIWKALKNGEPARDALVLEAARVADRLEDLDRIIQGDGVLELMRFRLDFPESDGEPFTVEVKFQSVLAEARQQQLAFAGLIDKIQKFSLTATAPKGHENKPLPAGVTPLDRIRGQVAERFG